jgi:tetratricopeptide (TPR) repeat protein
MAADELLTQGERAEQAGDLPGAIAAYEAVDEGGAPGAAALAAFRLGRISWRQSRYEAALSEFERARIRALQLEDRELCARAENGIGAVYYARGEYKLARTWYRQALTRTTDDGMRARIHLNLGVIANIEGDLEEARKNYVESGRVFSEVRDVEGEALALHNVAMLHADLAQWTEANVAYERCLELFEQLGNAAMVANVLVNRSELLVARGDIGPAIESCDRALGVYEQLGDEVGRGEALRWKGHALRRTGDTQLAERLLTESVRIAHRAHARLLEAESARELGALRGELGDVAEARRWYIRALTLFFELGAKREESDVRDELGRLERSG